MLDIGGGFQDCNFEAIAAHLNKAILTEFPLGVTIIAEPGRFFARAAYSLVCRVTSRRRQIGQAYAAGVPDMLYQNDGVYSNFMNVLIEKEILAPKLVKRNWWKLRHGPLEKKKNRNIIAHRSHRYSIWGPTCDSVDCVVREVELDSEVQVGDWLKYENMGGKSFRVPSLYLMFWIPMV